MSDRAIRHKVQSMGYWYASSRDNGPAHIITKNGYSLCGVAIDTRKRVEAKNLCGNCRRIAKGRYAPPSPRSPGNAETFDFRGGDLV